MSELAPRTKIFVGRLPDSCLQSDLETLFSAYGTVRECDILANYGFVHMSNPEEAEAAIRGLHNHELHGNRITVEASTSRPRTLPRGGGMGGFSVRGFPSRGRYVTRGYSTWGRTTPYPDMYSDRAVSAYSSQPAYDTSNRYNYYTSARVDPYASQYAYDVDYSGAYASYPYGAYGASSPAEDHAAAYSSNGASSPAEDHAAAYSSNAYSTNAYTTAGYSSAASNSSYPTYSSDSASLAWSSDDHDNGPYSYFSRS